MSQNSQELYLCKLNEDGISHLKKLIQPLIPIASQYFTSQQLTLSSLIWSVLIVLSGSLARQNKLWFSVSIVAVVMHIITDLLDGAVSQYSKDGMDRWNFFMDHLLDFVLTVSVFAGLAIYFFKENPEVLAYLFIIFALITINMVASFLMVGHQGLDLGIKVSSICFNIFHMHFVLIVFYFIIMLGNVKSLDSSVLLYIVALLVALTIFNIYNKQKHMRTHAVHST